MGENARIAGMERTIEGILAYPPGTMPAAQRSDDGTWQGTIVTEGKHIPLWRCRCKGHMTEAVARQCSEAEFATGTDYAKRRRILLYDLVTKRIG